MYVGKNTRLFFPALFHLLFFSLFSAFSAWAFDGQRDLLPNAPAIRQYTQKKGGIFSCGPVRQDANILRFLSAGGITTVEDYARWLQRNTEYTYDDARNLWLQPEEMLAVRKGDCEDYAFLNAAILRVMGYQPMVLAMGAHRSNHAICVFMKKGVFHWFDNARLRETNARTLDGFARHIFSHFGSDYLLELNFEDKNWKTLFLKSVFQPPV